MGELYLDKIELACAEEWERTHPFNVVTEQPLFTSQPDEQNGEEISKQYLFSTSESTNIE